MNEERTEKFLRLPSSLRKWQNTYEQDVDIFRKTVFKDKVHVTELYMSAVGCWYIFCIPALKLNYAHLIPKL